MAKKIKEIGYTTTGLIVVQKKGFFGLMNEAGELVKKPIYKFIDLTATPAGYLRAERKDGIFELLKA